MWKQWLIALVLVTVAAGAAVAYRMAEDGSQAQAGRERPPSAVNTRLPERDTVRDVVKSVGNLQALNAVELTAEVSGRVVAVNLPTGVRVERGTLLLKLDDRQARAELQVIESQLADARRQFDRAQRLSSNNSVSQAEVDALRTAVRVAEAQREAAQVQLDNHRIEAPFAGVVGLSDVEVGSYVNAGTMVTTLDATERMELNFSVPERYLGQVGLGQAVVGQSPAYPETRFTGELVQLGTRINEFSRALPVRALIDNPDGRLRPGQFMTATLTLQERQALLIPEQAVMIRGDEQYVFVAEDGVARRTSVRLGARIPGWVEVAEGLGLEDAVIVTGQDRISNGDRIRVLDSDQAIPENRFSPSLES